MNTNEFNLVSHLCRDPWYMVNYFMVFGVTFPLTRSAGNRQKKQKQIELACCIMRVKTEMRI